MFVKPLKKVGQSGRKKWNALWAFRRRGENSGGKSRFFVGAQRFFRGEFLLFSVGEIPKARAVLPLAFKDCVVGDFAGSAGRFPLRKTKFHHYKRLCCFRREISPAKAVFAFLAHIKKGAPRGDIRCHPLAPCSQKNPKRLPPCRAFLWLQAVSGGTTESVVWVILLTFLQLSPGERLPAPLAAVFSPSPA